MTKFGVLFCALCIVFCPIGLGMSSVIIWQQQDWHFLLQISILLGLSYLWVSQITENIDLKAKIKQLEQDLKETNTNTQENKLQSSGSIQSDLQQGE